MSCCGFPGIGGATPGINIPLWTKLSVVHAQFQVAGLTQNISLFSLPAGGLIHGVKLKTSEAFAGVGITGYFLSIGFVGALDDLLIEYSVTPAVANDTFAIAQTFDSRDHGAAVDVRIAARSTGANLNQSTAGAADIWLLISGPI
jgi:hypothetical protein